MSKLHIGKMSLFKTAQSVEEIHEFILRMPKEAQVEALTVLGMTWNFLAEMVEQHNKFGGDAVSTGEDSAEWRDS